MSITQRRIDAHLNKKHDFDGLIMTMREFLQEQKEKGAEIFICTRNKNPANVLHVKGSGTGIKLSKIEYDYFNSL